MTPRAKRRIWNVTRLAICALALWIVSWGVTLDDRVVLAGGSEALSGTIVETDRGIDVQMRDGTIRRLPPDEIARDAQGAPLIEYGLRSAWGRSDRVYLLLALVVFLPVTFILAVRTRLLLMVQDIRIGVWESVKLSFAGNFLNFAAPLGSTGGDVFKAYYFSLHTTHKTEAVTTVFIDRVIGMLGLVLVVAGAAVLSPSNSPLAKFRWYSLGILATAAVGAAVYLAPVWRRVLRSAPALLERLPMSDHLRRIDRTARALARRPLTIVAAFALTVVLQAIAVASYCLVALALGLHNTLTDLAEHYIEFYAYFATGSIVQALPGPPQGLGTVELAFKYFFAPYGSASQIVCMALAIRVVTLAASLPGLLVTLTGAYRPRPGLEQVVERIERESGGERTDPGADLAT
jgi:hypothetical protein